MKRRCERQIGIRPTFRYNALMVPVAVFCAHDAEPGSPFCHRHQDVD